MLELSNVEVIYSDVILAVKGITLVVPKGSCVTLLGGNGAGKSTMIKLLTGELEPTNGLVWKHPNLRIAYVAQHAFHHIEQVSCWLGFRLEQSIVSRVLFSSKGEAGGQSKSV